MSLVIVAVTIAVLAMRLRAVRRDYRRARARALFVWMD